MKYFIAIIKPFKLDDVRNALTEIGVEGLTASEVRGFGRQRGQTEIYRGAEYSVSFVPKLKIEIAVPDEMETAVHEALIQSASTGQIGDGKIFVFDLQNATRIRTGEKENNAL
jgi:nitrogen regulatory protein P-II 2